jgi:hypothetical protein
MIGQYLPNKNEKKTLQCHFAKKFRSKPALSGGGASLIPREMGWGRFSFQFDLLLGVRS